MKCRILLCANTNKEYYVEAVEMSGGQAVVSYCPNLSTDYDGLILCGGNDLDPKYYGEPVAGSVDIDHRRDETEWALLTQFIKTGKPIMGVCRGFQLLNVFLGGTLYQNMDSAGVHRGDLQHYPVHEVQTEKDSFLAQMYGEEFFVNSCHHQGIKTLGKGLRPIARWGALVEAYQHEQLPIFGVQWHPERMCYSSRREDCVDGAPLFHRFLELCKKKKSDE